MKLCEALVGVMNEALMPRFKSKIEDLLPKIQAKQSGQQLAAMLRNNGVTDEEIRWTKMDKLLKQDKVTKDEVVDHLSNHGLPFATSDLSNSERGHRYKDYALKGGEGYGEKLFHLKKDQKAFELEWVKLASPTYGDVLVQFNGYKPGSDYSGRYNPPADPVAQVFVEKEDDEGLGFNVSARCVDDLGYLKNKVYYENIGKENTEAAYSKHVKAAKEICEKKLGKIFGGMDNYTSSHWGDAENPLFHVRHQDFKDADGKHLWLIEEIQSDWHQAGRKKGYSDGKKKFQILHDGRPLPVAQDSGNEFTSQEDAEAYVKNSLPASMHANVSYRSYGPGGIPDAPMKKSWEEMAFKWALHQAVESGADRLGWITGEIAADRFDISKQVDHIRLIYVGKKYQTAKYKMKLVAYKDGHDVVSKDLNSEDEIEGVIGKEHAKKLLDQPVENNERELKGEALKVGGEGMKAAYDQRIVSIARKIAKSTGAMVGKVMLEEAEDEGEEVDPYEMMDVQVKYGSESAPAYDSQEEYEEDERDEDERENAGWWVTFENEPVEGTSKFDTKEEAEAAKERLGTIREAKKGHEVWYLELNDRVRTLVANGMRATFESVKPKKTSKPWWKV
jgi:hypothetical protein